MKTEVSACHNVGAPADDVERDSGGGGVDGATPRSVLLVTPRWARDGGVGAHVRASAQALARHGLRVCVLVAEIEAGAELAGVSVCESARLFDRRVSFERRMGEALSCDFELTHLHQVDDPTFVRALRPRGPVVLSAHGYTACTSGVYYFEPGQQCTRGHGAGCAVQLAARGCAHTRYPKTLPRKYLHAARGLAALRAADLAISYSSAVDRHLAANRVERRAIVPYFPTLTPEPACAHGRRRVVFAGRIVRPKGLDVLLRATCDVDGELVVCGSGRQLPEMRELAERLGVARRVRFAGWLDADGLARELAEASVLAMPSLWPEPFGIVGIEALAAGRPAVASATGGIGDWLEDGVSGLSVPPGDPAKLARALGELLDDPDRRLRMGSAGQATVARRFSTERHLLALLAGYRSARSAWHVGGTLA